MRRWVLALGMMLTMAGVAQAVSIAELARTCGDDAKAYCAGVGYGDPMQQCLDAHYAKLSEGCQAIMDRLRGGEGVYLF